MAGKPRKSAGTYSFTDLVRLTMRNPRLLLAALLTDGTTDRENAADSWSRIPERLARPQLLRGIGLAG